MTPEEVNEQIAKWGIGERVLRRLNTDRGTDLTTADVTFSVFKVDMSDEAELCVFTIVTVTRKISPITDLDDDFAVEEESSAGINEVALTRKQMLILDDIVRAQYRK